ncbi:hypothetical protein DL768_005579 [Monosporascus sp. mg162]|nr:hypothetical protein DL768_005579 [Monosporascus sp. mg162]
MTRYAPVLEHVLRGIAFEARAGQRVAVEGRTGAEKSTLMLALIRGLEADGGRIELDGVDIASLKMEQLRLTATRTCLFCITPALVRQSRVLVLGDATASIDHDMDALIQETLHSNVSANTTLLTTAYRLHT